MLTCTARGALNVTDSATGQESALPPGIVHEVVIVEAHSPQDIHTPRTDPVTEPTLNPVQSSNVFDEEVADIAQVHCDSELFEFELSTSPPCVNVKGNLRRNFFGSVLELLVLFLTLKKGDVCCLSLVFQNQGISKTTDRLFHIPSLLRMLFKT